MRRLLILSFLIPLFSVSCGDSNSKSEVEKKEVEFIGTWTTGLLPMRVRMKDGTSGKGTLEAIFEFGKGYVFFKKTCNFKEKAYSAEQKVNAKIYKDRFVLSEELYKHSEYFPEAKDNCEVYLDSLDVKYNVGDSGVLSVTDKEWTGEFYEKVK